MALRIARRPVSIREGVAVPFQSSDWGMLPEVHVILRHGKWRCTEDKKQQNYKMFITNKYTLSNWVSLQTIVQCSPRPNWAHKAPPQCLQVLLALPCVGRLYVSFCVSFFSWPLGWSCFGTFQRQDHLYSEADCPQLLTPDLWNLCSLTEHLHWGWAKSWDELGQSPVMEWKQKRIL